MHQNVSLRSNGLDRVRSLRKIPKRLRGTNFCTSSTRFATSFVLNETIQNAPKRYETHQTHEFSVKWGGSGVFVVKNSDATSWHELLH